MKTIEKQKIISNLIIYAGFFTGLMTLAGTAKEMKLKRDAKEAYLTSKIEYYEDLAKINNSYLKSEEQNYEAKLEQLKIATKAEIYNEMIKVEEKYEEQIKEQLKHKNTDYEIYGAITKSDLKYVKTLALNITKNSNIDFLQYCTNLEELTMYLSEEDTELLKELPIMENLKKLSLSINTKTFSMQETQEIIFVAPNLEELVLPVPTDYRSNTIESFKNLKKLIINPSKNCDINFNDLNLEELTICSNNPYNVAIWLNSEEYKNLKSNGTKVNFLSEYVEKEYLKASEQIDEIVNNLPITKESTDEEILDASIEYVIKNFKTKENEEINECMYLNHQHYIDGMLYGALKKDTQSSGNYAAMIDAIFDRTTNPHRSYILENKNGYMWNYVNLDGKEYYVDGKMLDETIFVDIEGNEISSEEFLEKGYLKESTIYKEPVVTYKASDNKNSILNSFNEHIAINTPKDDYQISGILEKKYTAMQENKSVEIPKLDIKLLQPSEQQTEKNIEKTMQEYDKKIKTSAITGITELAFALYMLIKKKYKNQIEEIKTYIRK